MVTFPTPVNELARACAHSAEAAEWEEFLRRCAPIATTVAAGCCLGAAVADTADADALQQAAEVRYKPPLTFTTHYSRCSYDGRYCPSGASMEIGT